MNAIEKTDPKIVSLRHGVRTEGPRTRALRRGLRLEYENGQFETREVAIRNGRPDAARFSLEQDGFEFLRQATAVRDFFDPDEVENVYYPEAEALIKRVTGAGRVILFDRTLRSGDETEQESRQLREPVLAVHNDYTERSAPQRVRDLLPDEAEELLQHRFQIVQAWRPIDVPARRSPLALCNAGSIRDEDLLLTELHYEHRVGEIYHLAHNPDHQWVYFPDMQPDEVLVFKVYDSDRQARARFTAHGAFEDPAAPADAPPRKSIEVRSLVFYSD